MASPEYSALQKSTATLCDTISAATTPVWFAQKLQGKGLITSQLQQNIVQTLGESNYDKVAKLLQAVVAQVRNNPRRFGDLVEILSEEPALESSVAVLTNALKEAEKQKTGNPVTRKPKKNETNPRSLKGPPLKDNTIINALHEAEFAAADWELLGVQLKIPRTQLDNIRANRSQAEMQLMDVITQWKRSDRNASWKNLVDALSKIGKYGPATAERFQEAVGLDPGDSRTEEVPSPPEEVPPPPEKVPPPPEEVPDGAKEDSSETLRRRQKPEPRQDAGREDAEEPCPSPPTPSPPAPDGATVESSVLAGFMNQLLLVGLILVIAILVVVFEKKIVPYFV